MPDSYQEKISATLADANLQLALYSNTRRLMEKRKEAVAPDQLPDYQELRERAHQIRKHTLENLDHYLAEAEANVTVRGGKVVFAKDHAEATDFILNLAKERGVRIIVKSKSMTTEEIGLNERLEHDHLEPVETDLGEFIIQLAHERPFHILAPALQKTRYDVADLFKERLGVERETVPEKQTLIARRVLREKFLAAGIGVTGANFVVADSGAVLVVENEGNVRLCTSAPKIHVAVAGIEKLIPRAQDLPVFLKLLARSATGQTLPVYMSFLAPPRREGELDGPEEFYLILLDNGRTRVLADRDKRESLYCVRCGACLNICPVYRKIGGHNYPWVYSGPIGAVITPQYMGVRQDPWLPFASSLCGACAEVCPVKIDLPRMLLALRSDVIEAKTRDRQNRLERLAFRLWARVMRSPWLYEALGTMAAGVAPEGPRWISRLPAFLNAGPLRDWISQRDLPPPARRSFRQLWRERIGTNAQ